MGEMADFAIDNAFEEQEYHDRHKDDSLQEQYEAGIIDQNGVPIGNPNSVPS